MAIVGAVAPFHVEWGAGFARKSVNPLCCEAHTWLGLSADALPSMECTLYNSAGGPSRFSIDVSACREHTPWSPSRSVRILIPGHAARDISIATSHSGRAPNDISLRPAPALASGTPPAWQARCISPRKSRGSGCTCACRAACRHAHNKSSVPERLSYEYRSSGNGVC